MSDPQDLDEMIQTTVAELMDERDSWSPEAVQYVLEKAIRLALDHRAVSEELLDEAATRLDANTPPSGYDRDIIKRLVQNIDPEKVPHV